ncbi:MAG: DUF721 domain-containing protein [Gammaproteobacteria bacterium]|nr:DUF721 domain-containing protein [Gammaproteobacteria bacterium]
MPRDPRPIQNVLKHSGKVAELLTRAAEQEALLQRVRAVSDKQSAQAILAALTSGSRLILYAASPAWASRLRFQSRTLLARLAQRKEAFTKVTVRVASAALNQRQLRYKRAPLSRENSQIITSTAESLKDRDLRAALLRLARHHGH